MLTFRDLSNETLLEKCLHGYSQNDNEAINSVIWKKCPKHVFVFKKVLKIAVESATIEFNEGSNGLKPVFYDLGLSFGYFIKKDLNKKDNLRIRQSERKSCDHGKARQKRLRVLAKNWTDKENQAEREKPSHSTGQF